MDATIAITISVYWATNVAQKIEWNQAHLGATISGLLFGYLTCPSMELDNAAKNAQKEAVALVRRQTHPCKSTAVFVISVLAFSLLAFAYVTQFNDMDLE